MPERKSASILIVEDNAADVSLIRKALEEHGVEGDITVLADGDKAITFIHALADQTLDCPNLVIIDLNLPRRSGREVLEAMRRSARCRDVPAVVLSSSDTRQDRADVDQLGASRYLTKPSRLDEFLGLGAIFKEVLEHHKP